MNVSSLLHSVKDQLHNVIQNHKSAPPAVIADCKDVFKNSTGEAPERDWTVLVYMEGRDRLAHSTDLALNKLEQVGSTGRTHVVVQATQEPTWQEAVLPNMHSLPTRRYYIQRDDKGTEVTSPVLQEFPNQVGLTKDSLADFVAWGEKTFPAKHYALIIKKHGAGFASVTRGGKSVVPASARDMDQALQRAEKITGKKLDVIGFDSCSMHVRWVAAALAN